MMKLLDNSAASSRCIPSVRVTLRICKDMLGELFRMPTCFRVSTFDHFEFYYANTGFLTARDLLTTSSSRTFDLLQPGFRKSMAIDGGVIEWFIKLDWNRWIYDPANRI